MWPWTTADTVQTLGVNGALQQIDSFIRDTEQEYNEVKSALNRLRSEVKKRRRSTTPVAAPVAGAGGGPAAAVLGGLATLVDLARAHPDRALAVGAAVKGVIDAAAGKGWINPNVANALQQQVDANGEGELPRKFWGSSIVWAYGGGLTLDQMRETLEAKLDWAVTTFDPPSSGGCAPAGGSSSSGGSAPSDGSAPGGSSLDMSAIDTLLDKLAKLKNATAKELQRARRA
jgi:hypothetical protein